MDFNTLGILLGIICLITALILPAFLISRLVFDVLNKIATFRYNNAVANQRRSLMTQEQEKLAYETETARYHSEKARLELEIMQIKIQRASENKNRNQS